MLYNIYVHLPLPPPPPAQPLDSRYDTNNHVNIMSLQTNLHFSADICFRFCLGHSHGPSNPSTSHLSFRCDCHISILESSDIKRLR